MEQVHNTNVHNGHQGLWVLATRKAFEFVNAEKRLEQLEEKKTKEQERYGEKDRPGYKAFLNFLFLIIAIGLCILNASNLYQAVVAILGVDVEIAVFISICFTFLGIVLGEGLAENLVVDPFTGKKKANGKFWGMLVVTVLYVGAIATLSIYAAKSTAETIESSVKFNVAFSIIIPLIEVAVGFFFMKDLFISISLLVIRMRINGVTKTMKSLSKQVENIWQRYIFTAQQAGITPQAPTEAVTKAREYYAQGYSNNYSFTNNTNN